jgi:hypothetical protein
MIDKSPPQVKRDPPRLVLVLESGVSLAVIGDLAPVPRLCDADGNLIKPMAAASGGPFRAQLAHFAPWRVERWLDKLLRFCGAYSVAVSLSVDVALRLAVRFMAEHCDLAACGVRADAVARVLRVEREQVAPGMCELRTITARCQPFSRTFRQEMEVHRG